MRITMGGRIGKAFVYVSGRELMRHLVALIIYNAQRSVEFLGDTSNFASRVGLIHQSLTAYISTTPLVDPKT